MTILRRLYTEAISVDPDCVTLYSNRSAAYLRADSKSKALWDAQKCIELDPTFIKGYSRLGAAQQSLGRFADAIETFKKGIERDPGNEGLWVSLRACQESADTNKKERFAAAEKERERQRELDEARDRARERQKAAAQQEAEDSALKDLFSSANAVETKPPHPYPENSKATSAAQPEPEAHHQPSVTDVPAEDDPLAAFFSEVNNDTAAASASVSALSSGAPAIIVDPDRVQTEKYTNQDLGDARAQIERLTQHNYEFRNLNPYYVLQLGTDATPEDIKYR